MASLYRKSVVVTDPTTGEKIKTQSKKWWGQFKDANGRLRRHPLAVDKMAAHAMLNTYVKRVEREKAGLVDPTDEQRKQPLSVHVAEFKAHQENKNLTAKQIKETHSQLQTIAAAFKWQRIADISVGSIMDFLGTLRRDGRSAQTCNHYLKAVKTFSRWLVWDRRTPYDSLAHLSRFNVAADRRHDRQALSQEEFTRLVDAAKVGKRFEGIRGAASMRFHRPDSGLGLSDKAVAAASRCHTPIVSSIRTASLHSRAKSPDFVMATPHFPCALKLPMHALAADYAIHRRARRWFAGPLAGLPNPPPRFRGSKAA